MVTRTRHLSREIIGACLKTKRNGVDKSNWGSKESLKSFDLKAFCWYTSFSGVFSSIQTLTCIHETVMFPGTFAIQILLDLPASPRLPDLLWQPYTRKSRGELPAAPDLLRGSYVTPRA